MSEYGMEVRLKTQEQMMLALQAIVTYVFSEIAKQDPKLEEAIKTGFDNAALSAEVLAMKEGGRSSKGADASNVLQLVEEMRKITFPKG
jgi:hypothetical protein